MPEKWRFIESGKSGGCENMARDEALLLTFLEKKPEERHPVFRVYGWSPPALSIGRFQNAVKDINMHHCENDDIPIVRRMTGGGAIFHDHEITYSLVCSEADLACVGSVKASFEKICGFLLLFYRGLGLEPSFAKDTGSPETLGQKTPLCFAGREEYDITVDGSKIGGNAQRRFKNVIFQHGSIPLTVRPETLIRYVKSVHADPGCHAASLSDFSLSSNPARLPSILKQSVEENFHVRLENDDFSDFENHLTKALTRDKYSHTVWNHNTGEGKFEPDFIKTGLA